MIGLLFSHFRVTNVKSINKKHSLKNVRERLEMNTTT